MKSKKMKPRPNYLSILSDYTQEDFPYSQIYYLITRDKITTIYLSQEDKSQPICHFNP